MKVKRTGAADYGRFIKMLLVGPPGSGKTTFASSFPNPLIAAAEPGLMAVADLDVPYVDIERERDLLEVKQALSQDAKVREKTFGFPVDSLIVDTFDEVQRLLMRERLAKSNNSAMQQQDWGWLLERQQSMVSGLRNLPLHVVLTCHMKTQHDEESGASWFAPSLSGGFADQIGEYVDIVGVMVEEQEKKVEGKNVETVTHHFVRTGKTPKYPFVKDRSGELPDRLQFDRLGGFDALEDLVFAKLASLKDGSVSEIDTGFEEPSAFVPEDSGPLEDIPKQRGQAKESNSAKAREAREERKATSTAGKAEKPAGSDSGASEAKPEADAEVKVLNKLPDGVSPNPKGHGTSFFCEVCGDEVESVDLKNKGRIKFRKCLCQKHFDEAESK